MFPVVAPSNAEDLAEGAAGRQGVGWSLMGTWWEGAFNPSCG